MLRLGGTRQLLFMNAPYEYPLNEPLPIGFPHVVFELDDYDVAVARLREADVPFILGPQEIEPAFERRRSMLLVAPHGVRTEIMHMFTDTAVA